MGEGRSIGVRYCGGCNPRYDRVAAVEELARLLPGWVLVPAQPGAAYPVAVVVCGCPARCAGTAGLSAPLVYLKDRQDLDCMARELARLLGGEGEQYA